MKKLAADAGAAVVEVLTEARRLGFLGPGPVEAHVDQALAFGQAAIGDPVASPFATSTAAPLIADLGAGGGVPAIPMAMGFGDIRMVLIDASAKRIAFLVWATVTLDLAHRVEVWCGRAEAFGHDADRRSMFDAVVARSFGPPATTLECAAPLLRAGGRCVVSEPPGGRVWPGDGVATFGFQQVGAPDGFAVFELAGPVPPRFARPAKEQRRAPIFAL